MLHPVSSKTALHAPDIHENSALHAPLLFSISAPCSNPIFHWRSALQYPPQTGPINSLAPKFEQLKEVIGNNLDILTIQETKLDSSFPPGQFLIDGYTEPYRLDRNRNGGGVMIYVREDIPSKLLTKHTFTEAVEGLFIEINLRKTQLLFFGSYRSDHPD